MSKRIFIVYGHHNTKKSFNKIDIPFPKKMYIQTSDFPSTYRDISFMLKDKKDIDVFRVSITTFNAS